MARPYTEALCLCARLHDYLGLARIEKNVLSSARENVWHHCFVELRHILGSSYAGYREYV